MGLVFFLSARFRTVSSQLGLHETIDYSVSNCFMNIKMKSSIINVEISFRHANHSAAFVSGMSRFVKFEGGEAAGRTPYTFYKPTLVPKYVNNRPYNEFITPIIGIFNGFPLLIFDVGYTLDSKYAVM